jgi:hypothetical protein
MNRRQIINKILHHHIDVNKHEDYTNYKKLINAIEEWHESEVKKLPIHIVSICFDKLTDEERIEIMDRYDKNIGTRNDNCC